MFISEVRSKEEGLEWARDLAGRIVASGRYSDEELVMEHTEVK